jgi:hypothetical protein
MEGVNLRMTSLTLEQIDSLFNIYNIEKLEHFFSSISINSECWRWLPLGGHENNSGSVNLAMDPGQALLSG